MNKKKTYKLQLPKDVNVDKAHLRIHNGQIVVDVEFKDKFEPKDGDFLVSKSGGVFIYSKKTPDNIFVHSAYRGVRKNDEICIDFSTNWTPKEGCRLATPEEKSAFLERLEKECHKTWNPATKQLEDIRWRPKEGDVFYFIRGDGSVDSSIYYEKYVGLTEEYPNCFKTENAAQRVSDKIKELLKQSKSE